VYARLLSGAVLGIEARLIEVQCDVSGGLPQFHVVGLAEKEVTESRERIRSAIKNAGLQFPAGRITANLAPADLRKEGVGFDVPIAVAILIAAGQLAVPNEEYLFVGELALDGQIRGVRGVLPIAITAAGEVGGMVVPRDNAREAALAADVPVFPIGSLSELVGFLNGNQSIEPMRVDREAALRHEDPPIEFDLGEVRGQAQAKRALEVAAAGGHNVLMVGPPGAGKSLLARCLPDLLPPMTLEEALDVTKIYSSAGLLEANAALIRRRPFRAPHQTISYAGMVGGGHGVPGPGEISLAHHGVLFLDELPEFDRRVLETLRQPLEERSILLSRAGVSVRYPASFTLIAAMNPCPCGYLGDALQPCRCTVRDIHRYRRRLSGPFLDRIDLFIEVPRLASDELLGARDAPSSEPVRARVAAARKRQWERLREEPGTFSNAQLDGSQLDACCRLDREARSLLKRAVARFGLSARAHVRILRVARTIADLEGAEALSASHVAEAVRYRSASESIGD
jgi:magnesium chelatase family protein